MRVSAIIPAAGKGRRIKSKIDKPYIELLGKPILAYTLLRLSRSNLIDEVIVAADREKVKFLERNIIDRFNIKKTKVIIGGRERIDSVRNALREVSAGIDYVVVHDGIRPFVTEDMIKRSLGAAKRFGAGVVAVPVKPTLKCAEKNGRVKYTPDRRDYWEAQTPQAFRRDLLERAYKKIGRKSAGITDDSMLVERLGIKPKLVMGSYGNIKITTQEDLELAKILTSHSCNALM
ncbi:MAG: 2-C-methyl-D-erythritol 4-phosphate cytidylyltransferase [Candidatus Omnitrophica bacterium]|nr:2-C-methyl-D-erythritol 4-phosphate cytidylyltransferase [Candidatus Omnitrophota bacterium]